MYISFWVLGVPEKPASKKHPNEILQQPQLTLFDAEEQWIYFKLYHLPSDITDNLSELLTLFLRLSLATLQLRHISVACFRNLAYFHDDLHLMTISVSRRIDGPVAFRLSSFFTLTVTSSNALLLWSILPSLINTTPRYMNSSAWSKWCFSVQGEWSRRN